MREVWIVKIYSMRNGKTDLYETQCEGSNELARIMITFKPKRGYEIVKFIVEKEWWLV